ncbi:hypothetical protein SO694_00005217 [Aureococcus anophagefferens]|uniref:Uncharacterized protein n=1 Tax=Aureococcus anophagefferens TaxID=44056 RepID=A0ABR1G998_AURAN
MGWPRYEHVSPDLFPVAAEAMDRGPARRSRFDDWDWVDVDGWETVRYACACPCLALGKVATLASAGEPTIPPLNFTRNGLDLCVASAPLGPCSAAAATVWQRRALADRYGLPGGPREALKGLIYPLALAQHLALAEAVAARGERRFAWERADHWKKDDRPAVPDFHVLIVAGVAQAGATSLVRSLVGAEPVDEDAEVDGDRSSGRLRPPGAVGVGARVVAVPGRPPCALRLWDLASPPAFGNDAALLARADAVVCVFDPDDERSLAGAEARYDALFPAGASAPPRVRVLLGNARKARPHGDVCEFFDRVDAAAKSRRMDAALLSAHAPSAPGTKRFLDMLATSLWDTGARDGEGWLPDRRLALLGWAPNDGDAAAFSEALGATLGDFEAQADGWRWIAVGRDDATGRYAAAALFADEGRYSEYARMFLDASPALRHGTSTYAVDAPCRLKAAKADPPAGGALWLGEVEAAPNRAALDAVAAGLAAAARRDGCGAVAVSKPFAGGSRLAFALVFDAAADLAAFRSATFDPLLADALVDGAALLVDDVTTLVASNDDERAGARAS